MDEILKIANKYAKGQADVLNRRNEWLQKSKEVLAQLKEIAAFLNEKGEYGAKYHVDVHLAYNEENHGTCEGLPSITFRSGQMPLHITFRNVGGTNVEFVEEGFHLTFTPSIAGEILVLLVPHTGNFTREQPELEEVAIIENPGAITREIINTIMAKGLEAAYFSSYTGLIERQNLEQDEEQKQYQRVPIGFKRFETTEK